MYFVSTAVAGLLDAALHLTNSGRSGRGADDEPPLHSRKSGGGGFTAISAHAPRHAGLSMCRAIACNP